MKILNQKAFFGIFLTMLFCFTNVHADTLDTNMNQQQEQISDAPFLVVKRINAAIVNGEYPAAVAMLAELIQRNDVSPNDKVILMLQTGMVCWNLNAFEEAKSLFHMSATLYQGINGYNPDYLNMLLAIEGAIQQRDQNLKFAPNEMLTEGENSMLYKLRMAMDATSQTNADSSAEQNNCDASAEQNYDEISRRARFNTARIRAEMARQKRQAERRKQNRIEAERQRLRKRNSFRINVGD